MLRSLQKHLSVTFAGMVVVATPCWAQSPSDTLKTIAKDVRGIQEQIKGNTADVKTIQAQLSKMADSKAGVIHFAVGLGVRFIYDEKEYFGEPSISPIDSTLQIDSRDRGAVILSGVIMATPFVTKTSWISNLGFVANLNLAEISSENVNTINNKSIEGGLGISYQLQSNFALAVTYDLVYSRRLRDYVLTRKGDRLFDNGKVLTKLNRENDNLFIDDNLSSLSLKFIYRFGK